LSFQINITHCKQNIKKYFSFHKQKKRKKKEADGIMCKCTKRHRKRARVHNSIEIVFHFSANKKKRAKESFFIKFYRDNSLKMHTHTRTQRDR